MNVSQSRQRTSLSRSQKMAEQRAMHACTGAPQVTEKALRVKLVVVGCLTLWLVRTLRVLPFFLLGPTG